MDSREQFEAWFDREYPRNEDGRRIGYQRSSVQELMIAAWQASRRAALEEAAKVCDDLAAEWNSDAVITDLNYAGAAATRIRTLPTGDTNNG